MNSYQKRLLATNRMKLHAAALWQELIDYGRRHPDLKETQEWLNACGATILANDWLDRLVCTVEAEKNTQSEEKR